MLDHAPTGVELAVQLADGLVAVTMDGGCLSVLQFGLEARNAGMGGSLDQPIVWVKMLDENLALLVGAEVVVGEIRTDQPGAVAVAVDARQLRLASAG